MKIKTAEFVTSIAKLNQMPTSKLPEIAFIGRSNVGKSSLINSLCNRKSLARTSSEPGKTRVMNFYRVNNAVHFVDLPGYGYAKVPDQIRSGWQHLIEGYLRNRENIKLSLLIIDARHDPTKLDLAMMEWLEYYAIPYGLVLTKSDKVPQYKLQQRIAVIQTNHLSKCEHCKAVLSYSSLKGEGRSELLALIKHAIHMDSTIHSSNV